MGFQVGDRVIRGGFKYDYKDDPIEIIVTLHRNRRYVIKYLNQYNIQGQNVTSWVHEDDLEYDKAYYREIKINQILNET